MDHHFWSGSFSRKFDLNRFQASILPTVHVVHQSVNAFKHHINIVFRIHPRFRYDILNTKIQTLFLYVLLVFWIRVKNIRIHLLILGPSGHIWMLQVREVKAKNIKEYK